MRKYFLWPCLFKIDEQLNSRNKSHYIIFNHDLLFNFLINLLNKDETNLYICESIIKLISNLIVDVYFIWS